jgi:hypothetical protein
MSNVFNLDSLREEIEKEFAPLQLEIGTKTVTLSNLMRLPKKKREAVMVLLKELENETDAEIDVEEITVEVLTLVSDNATLLRAGLKDDLATAMRILTLWMNSTQAGEAESSSS